jgi:NADP-dependent 3-hydroxy acid dehydrogenase YdfG
VTLVVHPRAVVTGAGSGLGRAFCVELSRRGARVVGADVRESGLKETAALLSGAPMETFVGDVSKRETVDELARFAHEKLGGVDLLINNAGVAVAGEMGTVSGDDWSWIVGVNLLGVAHGCEAFIPAMRKQNSGHVINVASLAGIACAPTMAPYNATKAAVIAISETLAGELHGTGVGVTVLCPSFFPTNIMNDARGGELKAKGMAEKMMAKSKWSAADVARMTLDGAAAGQLYVLPHAEGRLLWWVKRGAPQAFHHGAATVLAKLQKRMSS